MKNTNKNKKNLSAKTFDQKFDDAEDLSDHFDFKNAKMHYPTQRITIDFPKEILIALDHEAAKVGVTRTSLIKMWVADHLIARQSKQK